MADSRRAGSAPYRRQGLIKSLIITTLIIIQLYSNLESLKNYKRDVCTMELNKIMAINEYDVTGFRVNLENLVGTSSS